MASKSIFLSIVTVLAGFTLTGMGQCLDTRTLLDSIYSISLNQLNSIAQVRYLSRNNDVLPPALDSIYRTSHKNRGDIYQPILIDKIFRNKKDLSSELDGSYFYIGNNYKDKFITKVKFSNTPNFFLIILSDGFHNLYLATVSKDFAILSLLAFDTENFPLHGAQKSTKGILHTLNQSGITSTLTKEGIITQTNWSSVKNSRTLAALQRRSKTMHYRIDTTGRISPYKVIQQGQSMLPMQHR